MNDSFFLSKTSCVSHKKFKEILLFLIKFSSLILSCVCMYIKKWNLKNEYGWKHFAFNLFFLKILDEIINYGNITY